MKNTHDQFAKGVLKAALSQVARLESNREIPGHILAADLWLEPTGGGGEVFRALGALGRMVAAGPGLVEPFSGVPRLTELRSCILKQYSLDHAQRRTARTSGAEPSPFPRLWVLASGSPDSGIEQLELRPMDGWPDGFMTGRSFDPLHLVILRKLPRTRETLLLRLLGRGRTFREAVREMAELASDSPLQMEMINAVRQVVIEFRQDLTQHQHGDHDMPTRSELIAAYDEWEDLLRSKFRREFASEIRSEIASEIRSEIASEIRSETLGEARRKGLVETIEGFCEFLGIELTEQRRADMADWDVEQLEHTAATLRTTRSWPSEHVP